MYSFLFSLGPSPSPSPSPFPSPSCWLCSEKEDGRREVSGEMTKAGSNRLTVAVDVKYANGPCSSIPLSPFPSSSASERCSVNGFTQLPTLGSHCFTPSFTLLSPSTLALEPKSLALASKKMPILSCAAIRNRSFPGCTSRSFSEDSRIAAWREVERTTWVGIGLMFRDVSEGTSSG